MTPSSLALLAVASLAGGAINAVAGGGSLLSFPAAIAAGMSPIVANATNTVAMAPASLLSAVAYRSELGAQKDQLRLFAIPSLVGAIIGALLLLYTPQSVFDSIVPILVAFAAGLLVVQNLRQQGEAPRVRLPKWLVVAFQLLVAVYGGYFGAGMGIMMLAMYAAMGATDIHRMNALKTLLGGAINGVAAIAFVIAGSVSWGAAILMIVSASIGGFAGAAIARKVKPSIVRWSVATYGVILAVALGLKRWG